MISDYPLLSLTIRYFHWYVIRTPDESRESERARPGGLPDSSSAAEPRSHESAARSGTRNRLRYFRPGSPTH